MRNGSRWLRTPLKLLAVASGLLLVLLVASQSLPLFRGMLGPSSSAEASAEPIEADDAPLPEATPWNQELIAEENLEFSGSAMGRAPVPAPHSDRAASTIEVGLSDAAEPPSPDRREEAVSERHVRQLQERLDELERQAADWKRHAGRESSAPSQEKVDALETQLRDLQSELRTMTQRLGMTEGRLQVVQTSLRKSDDDRPSDQDEPTPAARVSIRTVVLNGESRLAMEARDASLPELFARLGEASGVNLLVAPEVTGTASLHLTLPNAEAALDAVCRIHHCRHERVGGFVVVSRETDDEPSAKPKTSPTVTKLYHLQHLSGAEIRPYVQALLTPGLGTVSFASVRERVGRTDYRDPPRSILVKDTADVLADVDRLILEMDQPPVKGKPLRPLSPLRSLAPTQPVSQPQSNRQPQKVSTPNVDLLPPPPSEAWPSRGPITPMEPAAIPPAESAPGPALLPTGSELPGPCLDCENETFEPPLVREKANRKKK